MATGRLDETGRLLGAALRQALVMRLGQVASDVAEAGPDGQSGAQIAGKLDGPMAGEMVGRVPDQPGRGRRAAQGET